MSSSFRDALEALVNQLIERPWESRRLFRLSQATMAKIASD